MAAELLGVKVRTVQRHYERLTKAELAYSFRYSPEEHDRGALPMAYGLSDCGVELAFAEGFATDSTKTIKEKSKSRIEHELMISAFHLELAKLCGTRKWDLRWRQRNLNHAVAPDALFAVNGGYFFLEIERAKLGNYRDGRPQILRKLESYRDYWDSPTCEKEFGFRTFHVVTVMRTPQRAQNLANLLKISGLDNATFFTSSEANLVAFTASICVPSGRTITSCT